MPSQYKIIIFDMDGVIFEKPSLSRKDDIVGSSSWDVIFDNMGIYDLHERLRDIYVRKGFRSYMDWSDAACCVLKAKGLDSKTFNSMVESRDFVPGAKETFAALKEAGMLTGIVSGSFDALVQRARTELGIKYTLAHCDLEFDTKGGMQNWRLLATDYKDKIKFVKYIAQINKISMKECVYVGDDVNDLPVFQRVGLSIAFNCTKREVLEKAGVVAKEKNLSAILPHLGLGSKKA